MKFSLRHFQGLRWKLTWPYMVFTPIIMLLVETIIVIFSIVIIVLFFMPSLIQSPFIQYAHEARVFFVHGSADRKALDLWAEDTLYTNQAWTTYTSNFTAIVDKDGRVLNAGGTQPPTINTLIDPHLPTEIKQELVQILSGKHADSTKRLEDDTVFVIVPIKTPDGRVAGAIIENTGPDLGWRETIYWIIFYIPIFGISILFYLPFGLVVGFITNIFTARHLTRRFKHLTTAAQKWSKGDFSIVVQDHSRDEIGELTRTLNRMAEQLQNLLQSREKLAVLEERHRLARDLHDSVKQHIFVVSLLVGTTRLRLRQNIDESEQSLMQAEQTLQHIQQELKTLIRELRPVALEKGLVVALREHVRMWQQQTGIMADIKTITLPSLSPLVEEAFFRVAQEALANVARHSEASNVHIELYKNNDDVALSIKDNGCGFDPLTQAEKGFGLRSIQERIRGVGGTVDIVSVTGKGTTINVSSGPSLTT